MTMSVVPILKSGSCPTGYVTQGCMCVPQMNATPVIAKNGPCPSGWTTQGNYCVAGTPRPKIVVPKQGPCPAGYRTEGNYCVQL